MQALTVGAGPVGHVFAAHLARGGASVTMLARARQRQALEAEQRLRYVRRWLPDKTIRWTPARVATSAAEALDDGDQPELVVLGVSSPALRRGTWLAELAEGLPHATFLMIQPGLDDANHVAAQVGHERLVRAIFGFLAWPETDGNTMLLWVPPGGNLLVAGPSDPVATVVTEFARGGLPTRIQDDITPTLMTGGATLETAVAALELADWSFRGLRADRRLRRLAGRAARQALAAGSAELGLTVPKPPAGLIQRALWGALAVAPALAPLDLEAYFAQHFGKLTEQTRGSVRRFAELAQAHHLPDDALRELYGRLTASSAGEEVAG